MIPGGAIGKQPIAIAGSLFNTTVSETISGNGVLRASRSIGLRGTLSMEAGGELNFTEARTRRSTN